MIPVKHKNSNTATLWQVYHLPEATEAFDLGVSEGVPAGVSSAEFTGGDS